MTPVGSMPTPFSRAALGLLSLLVLLITGVFFTPGAAVAQDLEPRRWSHLPEGSNVIGLGYASRSADIFFNPIIGITDGSADVNAWVARYSHAFDWSGKTARFDVIAPYVSGDWRGLVGTEPGRRQINAGGDPWLRLSMNFVGAPALSGKAFQDYVANNPIRTTVGASLAVSLPFGSYDARELINIGRNRYAIRPQVGVLHQRHDWAFELTGSAFIFTDNDDFVEELTLSQDPVWALQAHVTRNFAQKFWLGAGLAYAAGGRVDIEGLQTSYKVDNVLWNVVGSYQFVPGQSVVLAWQQGRTQVNSGSDTDSWALSWVLAWGR